MKNKQRTNKQEEKEIVTEEGIEYEQIDEKQKELDNVKNQLVRALADYQNQNKRFQEERAQIFTAASQNVLENLIPVLDILEKAQEHVKDQGLAMAISQFKKVLEEEGLEEIKPEVHNPFDHELMEVVESVRSEGEKDTVAEVVLNGWKFKEGKVVRYAKVKVYKGE
jgi:molecular chaperone GrpE